MGKVRTVTRSTRKSALRGLDRGAVAGVGTGLVIAVRGGRYPRGIGLAGGLAGAATGATYGAGRGLYEAFHTGKRAAGVRA